ncbi:hypothetical protein Afil01_16030 [Actinorhabdospora filicis]|uniref:DUF1707 domain-containing protein n=1 Tax=Actinorhabdospora filicis TaxID=1785913 RepID=A0A9W6SLI0_9ACTN|nr:DUF1707 domain-containing protein [Actinorhabdospora filicis]GLZ76796.1 hypothetical protein Afil01_16030 [Actinorhabdospora filicis]
MDSERMRAGDSDREKVVERLRTAMSEGRLSLAEYDERVAEAYKAQTYADLNELLVDLPAPASAERSQLVPPPSPSERDRQIDRRHRDRRKHKHSIANAWKGWAGFAVFLTGIWFLSSWSDIQEKGWSEAMDDHNFWPMWPIAGIGLIVLMRTISGSRRHDD